MNFPLRMQPDFGDFSYNIAMLYGIHVGHSFVNCLFYTAWLIFTFTNNILIINLFKTIRGMKSGLASLIAAVSSYQPIWFINLDQAAGIPVRFLAMTCGEFSATSFWISGFISNYNSVYNTYSKLRKMSWFAYPTRNKNANDSYKLWFLTRSTWPRTIFISNVSSSYQPAKESLSLAVPCLGIVDTNTYTHVVSIPIPGNDDSLDCLVFYNSFISKFILLRKHYLIITWYLDTRNIKRIFSFKEWIKKRKFNNTNDIVDKKKKNLILSNIKFRFNLLKNIQLGMNILFKQNSKYEQKNFEYLDIFKYGKRKNNKSIEKLLIIKRKLHRILEDSSKYYIDLKRIYFNKKLWNIHYMVRSRFFQDKYFKTTLYTQNYFSTNIKIERFYKTHIRWNSINNTIAPKIYKFFLFYNFLKFKKLSTKIYNSNILNSVYFKLIVNQLWSKNKKLNNNKISYKKELNFFSFQNLYKMYNKNYKNMLIGKFFVVLNKKNWLHLSKYNRNQFFNKIKFLYEFKMFKNFYKIKNHDKKSKLYSLKTINKNLKFFKNVFKNYYKFGLRKFISILTLKNIFLKYKEWKQTNQKSKMKIQYFVNKQKRLNYLQNIGVIKYNLEKRFKYLNRKLNKERKIEKGISFMVYNEYIRKFLYFMKNVLCIDNWLKYKQIIFSFIKLYTQNHFFNFEYRYFSKFIMFTVFNKVLPLIKQKSTKIWNTKKIFISYLKKFNKKKNFNNALSSLYNKTNIYKFDRKLLNNKNVLYKNKYSLYKNYLFLHSFYNIIKYEYKLYLNKNPYKLNSLNYLNYINYKNFIKWKRKKIINNLNWKLFDKYYSYNKKDFYKDLFVRYKNLYATKFIYKNNKLNSLFSLVNNKNKFINNYKYYLGWFVFKTPIKLKDWFYQKDFFCFPNWFYNYEKIVHLSFIKKKNKKELKEKKEDLARKERNLRIKGDKNLLIKKNKKLKILNFILSKNIYNNLKLKKKNLYLSLRYKKLLPLNYEIRRSIKKILLNYAYILWNKKYTFEFKKEFLTEILIYLFKHYSLIFKKKLLDKIRFNKKIRNWQVKLSFLTKIEDFFSKSMNKSNKIYSILEILKTKRYDANLKKKKIQSNLEIWNKNDISNNERLLDISFLFNKFLDEQYLLNNELEKQNLKYKQKLKQEKDNRKKSIIIFNNYTLFQKKYNQKLLNKYNIGSSINNLFYKYYNIPKLDNYKEYNNYFKHFKLILSDKLDKKRAKIKKRNSRNFRESKILLHKTYLHNGNINLYKFYIMYGFKWIN